MKKKSLKKIFCLTVTAILLALGFNTFSFADTPCKESDTTKNPFCDSKIIVDNAKFCKDTEKPQASIADPNTFKYSAIQGCKNTGHGGICNNWPLLAFSIAHTTDPIGQCKTETDKCLQQCKKVQPNQKSVCTSDCNNIVHNNCLYDMKRFKGDIPGIRACTRP